MSVSSVNNYLEGSFGLISHDEISAEFAFRGSLVRRGHSDSGQIVGPPEGAGIYLEERDLVMPTAKPNAATANRFISPFFKASKDKSETAVAAPRLDRAPRT